MAAQRRSSSSDGARQWRRLRLGFCEGEATAAGLGFQGVRGVAFIGADVPLDVRATPRPRRHGIGSDSESFPLDVWATPRLRRHGIGSDSESFLGTTRGRQRT